MPFGTSSNNVIYQARYTTTFDLLHGGEGWQEGDFFHVFMMDAYYRVTIETISTSKVQGNLTGYSADIGVIRPQPTPFDTQTTITSESILGDIRKQITGNDTNTGNGFTVNQIGTGLHIKRSTIFNASTPVGDLLNVIAAKVNDVGDLPSQCKHGMVVEVVNSEAEEDNHFVKFFGKLKTGGDPDNDNDYLDGEGTWEECAKPGRLIELKKSTMPVLLIRTADGNFRLTELNGSTYSLASEPQEAATFMSSANVELVTVTRNNHGFIDGQLVNIESANLTNGQYNINFVDANSFTYTPPANEGTHINEACTVGRGFFSSSMG